MLWTMLPHISLEWLTIAKSTSAKMVGVQGFEPWTLWSQTRCATRLRYTPKLVRMTGIEPARLAAREPKSRASAYFATSAKLTNLLCMYYSSIFMTLQPHPCVFLPSLSS
jgi:hypothetical protein